MKRIKTFAQLNEAATTPQQRVLNSDVRQWSENRSGWAYDPKKGKMVDGGSSELATLMVAYGAKWDKKMVLSMPDAAAEELLILISGKHPKQKKAAEKSAKDNEKILKKFTKDERVILDTLDLYLGQSNKNSTKNFKQLFDAYGESIADTNEPDDEEDADAFRDSTLKHQVFDYWDGPMRDLGSTYDFAALLAKYLEPEELADAIKGLKK